MKNLRFRIIFFVLIIFSSCFFQLHAQERNIFADSLVSIYNSGGSDALKKYASENISRLNRNVIETISRSGLKNNDIKIITAAGTLAEILNDSLAAAVVVMHLGRYYDLTGDTPAALEKLNTSVSIYKKKEEFNGMGNSYLYLGVIYDNQGDPEKSIEMYNNALECFKKTSNLSGQGNVLQTIGDFYQAKGDNEKSMEAFDKALELLQQSGDSMGIGNVYYCQGNGFLRNGDSQKALEKYSNALLYFKAVNSIIGEANIYLAQGDVYQATFSVDKALEMYDKALVLFKDNNMPLGTGNSYMGKGDVYFSAGHNKEAEEMYSKALPYFEQMGSVISQAIVFQRQGELALTDSRKPQALELLLKALPVFQQAGDVIGEGNICMDLGEVYYSMGDYTRAEENYLAAVDIFLQADIPYNISSVYLSLAKTYEARNETAKAKESYTRGISLFEDIRTNTGFSDMKMSFMELIFSFYESCIKFMINNNFTEEAFRYTESLKGRMLLDLITEKKLSDVEKGLDPKLKEQKKNLTDKISSITALLYSCTDSTKADSLQKELDLNKYNYEQLVQQIRFRNPLYASVNYPSPVSADSLRKHIIKPGEAVVEYFLGSEDVYAFILTKEDLKVIKLPVESSKLISSNKDYFGNITKRGFQVTEDIIVPDSFLVKPLLNHLNGISSLIIIPDGQLSLIPFESVITGTGDDNKPRYLVEDYDINYFQCASLLALMRISKKEETGADSFIGFGDPEYGDVNSNTPSPALYSDNSEMKDIKRDSYRKFGGALERLPGTGKEISSIEHIFKSNNLNAKTFLLNEASEENAKNAEVKNYSYISFACHGLINDDFQCLALSHSAGSGEDGYFSIDEIMNLDWNAKLVVLSACNTGHGEVKKGEGVMGLTRAVMYAGSPAAVVSLWSVSDEATTQLMVNFFSNLVEKKMGRQQALRQAKLEMLQSAEYSSPYFWSAFVMYGE